MKAVRGEQNWAALVCPGILTQLEHCVRKSTSFPDFAGKKTEVREGSRGSKHR